MLAIVSLVLVVGLAGSLAARRLAEREAVNDAATIAGVLADTVVQPLLTSELEAGEPAAVASFDASIRALVLQNGVTRVKLWTAQGKILYADEPALVGRTFALGELQRAALDTPSTRAEISDLKSQENAFETGGKLVEVYRPMWFPDGKIALFEIYRSYESVSQRSGQLWRGFAGVTLSSLLFFVLLLSPLVWRLVRRVQAGERARAELLQRAVQASDDERRRIAATFHDGPVQELAAASFAVAGVARVASTSGQRALAGELDTAARSLRGSIRALRSLLVEIYPPSLSGPSLGAALDDLAQGPRASDLTVAVDIDERAAAALSTGQIRQAYRVAQECLRNAAAHAGRCSVLVRLALDGPHVVLEIRDDGVGFDADLLLSAPAADHFGLRLLADAADVPGSRLEVATAPGAGTAWRMTFDAVEDSPTVGSATSGDLS